MRISQQIFPRVVALITTISKDEKPNVMTADFLMPISFKPKYVAFSIAPTRYSFQNLKAVKEFALNVCEEDMREKAEICGSYSGRNTNKFKLANLQVEKSKSIKPPVIKNSPISFECKVELMRKFGDHWLVVGKVVNEHIRKEVFKPLLHQTKNIYPKLI